MEIKTTEEDFIEELAELEHKQWTHWTLYFLENQSDENRERWKVQSFTDYENLTEKEKDSDRIWAKQVLKLIKKKWIPLEELREVIKELKFKDIGRHLLCVELLEGKLKGE